MEVRRAPVVGAAVCALLAGACSGSPSTPASGPEVGGTQATSPLGGLTGPVVVAVGDVACAPGSSRTASTCQHARTARLARRYDPRLVLGLGDLQYEAGTLSDYLGSYASTWGALRSITRPVPGNHEQRTAGAAGYYRYFRNQQPGAPGYYAFDIGSWRVFALNTNCDAVDCAREDRWLERDMANHPRKCSLVTMHHPRYSSSKHGSNTFVTPFWRTALRHRTDVALAGHDHVYERFRRMNASGVPSRSGIASFVSGAGGKSLYSWYSRATGSAARHNGDFGVLVLRLGRGAYAWEYRTVGDEVVDSGTSRCS